MLSMLRWYAFVTSVAAWALYLCISLEAVLLRRAMLSMLRWYAFLTSSSLTTSLIRFQRSGWSSHWWALSATWVPSGFVSTSTSPTTALSGIMNSFGWQMVVPTPPTVHHGFITVWPPVTVVPASRAQSLNPRMISGTTTSR